MKVTKRNKVFMLFAMPFLLGISGFAQENTQAMDKMWGESNASYNTMKNGKGKMFDEGNYGMFVHWGLFSNLGGVWKDKTYYGIGEWIMNPRMAGIPVDEYKAIAKDFNPVNYDAKKIAQLAKDAGMKYIIITSKHHEGFAMFDSKVSDFNIVDASPFGRDPMHELADACHELGLGFGFYYSHNQDWTAPGGTRGPKVDEDGKSATFKDYFYNKCKPQVREICSNYGKIDFVWFDTPGDMEKQYVVELVELVRELQPDAMMCSRVGHGMGDYASKGDMEVPTENIPGLWETADTNNDSWSYAWYDNNFKSPKTILHRVIETVARGGTYLFNVGPNSKGDIPQIGVEFLEESGKWIKKYPQVVYGAGASPWGRSLPWGDITTKDNSLFLAVSEWPRDGKLYLPGLTSRIKSVHVLNGSKKIETNYKQKNDWTILDVPYKAPESLISIIEIELDEPASDIVINTKFGVMPNVKTQLLTESGQVTGADAESIRWMEKFGEWKHAHQISNWTENGAVTWDVDVQEAGYYYVSLCYAGADRLVWKITTDEDVMVQNQQGATSKYVYYDMGILEFKTSGRHTISVSLVEGDTSSSSLKSIVLKPINN